MIGNGFYSSSRSSPAIASDGTVYVGGFVGNSPSVYAINSDGTLQWHYTTTGWHFYSPAIADDGSIYVCRGGGLGAFIALNPDGSVQFTYSQTNCTYVGAPSVAGDGTIYVGESSSAMSHILAFNPDGNIRWSYDIGAYNLGEDNSAIIASDSTIYVRGAYTIGLLAIGPTSPYGPIISYPVYE